GTSARSVAASMPLKASLSSMTYLLLVGINLHQPIQEVAALEEGLHPDILVEPMHVAQIRPQEHRLEAIGRNAHRIQELPVGRARMQHGDDGNAGPELRGELLDRL